MNSFTYCVPTKVIFGENTEQSVGQEIARLGYRHVLVLYGGGSVRRSGLLERVCTSLSDAAVTAQVEGGVMPNPRQELAQSLVDRWTGRGIDFLLAVGGGSVIDCAKAVALGLATPDVPVWEYFLKTRPVKAVLPVGAVLTIPASGSECSNSAVLTQQSSGFKRGLSSELFRPRFAIMNPALCATLPAYQIGCGVTDIMMHTLDRYFNNRLGNQLTDALGEALLRTVMENGLVALDQPDNYQAMSELMWGGSLSHNELTGLGGAHDFSVHQLGHVLSARFDMAHGASLAVMWPAWARYCWHSNPGRFEQYARNVWGIESHGEEAVMAAIDKTQGYFRALGMPVCFSQTEFGLQDEASLRDMAYRCTYENTRTVGNFQVLDQEDILEIYRLANH